MATEEPDVTVSVKYGALGELHTLNCIYDFSDKPIPGDDQPLQCRVSVEGSGNLLSPKHQGMTGTEQISETFRHKSEPTWLAIHRIFTPFTRCETSSLMTRIKSSFLSSPRGHTSWESRHKRGTKP